MRAKAMENEESNTRNPGVLRRVVVVLKVLVGLILVSWLVSLIDSDELREAIAGSRPGWMATAFLTFSGVVAFETTRIWLFFKVEGLRFLPAARIFLESLLFMNLLPGTIGADGYLITNLRQYGITVSTTRVVFLRIAGILVLLTIALVSLPFAVDSVALPESFRIPITVNGALAAAGVTMVMVAGLAASPHTRGFIINQVKTAYGAIVTTPMSAMIGVLGVTALMQLTRALMFVALVASYGEVIDFSTGILVAAAGVIALFLPISFSGLGVREAAIAGVLVAAGIPPSTSVIVALTSRVFLLIGPLLGLGCLLAGRARFQ